jgi:hypothetical protein
MTERRVKPLPFIQTGSGASALVFIHGLFDDGSFSVTFGRSQRGGFARTL